MNARIGITNGNLKVSAYARNLFDEKFLAEVIPAAEFAGSFVSPGARRLSVLKQPKLLSQTIYKIKPPSRFAVGVFIEKLFLYLDI